MSNKRIALSKKNQDSLMSQLEEYIKDDRQEFSINPRILAWMLEHINHLQGEIETEVGGMPTMSVEMFHSAGFLQELNRVFLHPLGLALSVRVNSEGKAYLFGPVYDGTRDPEGFYFGEFTESDVFRGVKIQERWNDRRAARVAKLGYLTQPLIENKTGNDYK